MCAWIRIRKSRGKPMPFLQTEFDEREARFSPNMHWMAYFQNKSGRSEFRRRRYGAITLARSCFVAPSANNDLIRWSIETEGSPASIWATCDWLDFSNFANSNWFSFFLCRRLFKFSLNISLSSIYAASAGAKPKNSWASPTFQPLSSRRFFFLFSMIAFTLIASPDRTASAVFCKSRQSLWEFCSSFSRKLPRSQ